MVEMFLLGGWMMWPLLAVSIAVLAIVIERGLVVLSCPFPDGEFTGRLLAALERGDMVPVAEAMGAAPLLEKFAAALAGASGASRETALRIAGEEVLAKLEARLPLLTLLARVATLMGLLGTIQGMITTFSRIADTQSGVDMPLLAGGIWQALITTATGLIIAIPTLFCIHLFQGKARRVAASLNEAGNAALTLSGRT
jgi:biopolymer transport protein ExbB